MLDIMNAMLLRVFRCLPQKSTFEFCSNWQLVYFGISLIFLKSLIFKLSWERSKVALTGGLD